MKITIESYNSFNFHEIWLVTEFRDGCVYKTVPVGFVPHRDLDLWLKADGPDTYIESSISTKLTEGRYTILDPFLPDGPENPANAIDIALARKGA
jgi:hypothetical protein